jgi:hypothetical protein
LFWVYTLNSRTWNFAGMSARPTNAGKNIDLHGSAPDKHKFALR